MYFQKLKQKEYHAICDNLNATGGYAKWNKSDKERLKKNTILYHLYVLSLKLVIAMTFLAFTLISIGMCIK